MLDNVEKLCDCGFTSDRVTDEVFQCFPASPQAVTYRATLHGTAAFDTAQLISHIEQWIDTGRGATVTTQQVLLRVDGSCTVAVSSLVDEECQERNAESVSDSFGRIVVIGSLSGGIVGAIIVTAIFVTLIVTICVRKNRLKHNGERYS